jgi:hypothetical protein
LEVNIVRLSKGAIFVFRIIVTKICICRTKSYQIVDVFHPFGIILLEWHYNWLRLSNLKNKKTKNDWLIDCCLMSTRSILGLGLWCLTPLSTIFSYIVADSFITGENYRPDKLYHIMLYRLSQIRTHNVSGDRYWLHR